MIARRQTERCRLFLLGVFGLWLGGCSPADDPPARAGEWLVDLGSVDCTPTPVVSFSVDREWMLFWIRHFHTNDGSRESMTSPALLRMEDRRLVLPAGPADRTEGPSFTPYRMCWDDAGHGVYVLRSGRRAVEQPHWYRAELTPDSQLERADPPPESCRQPAEVEWQWHRERVLPDELRGGLVSVADGCCAVELRRSDGVLLARHEARSRLSNEMSISRFAWSESGSRLAYRLNEEISWWFGRPTRSFVVEPSGRPVALDGQVYGFAWRGDNELIACVNRPRAEGDGSSLKRWRFAGP